MDVYLIRHADAAPLGEKGTTDDAERPLTPEGVQQAKVVAAGLQARGVRLTQLISSPLLRAQQTAEYIQNSWEGPAPELRLCDDLAPGGKLKRLGRLLRKSGAEAVGLVGHQPDIGRIAGWLIGDRKVQIDFAKGGVACIHCVDGADKGLGTLIWLVTPEWLAK